MLPEGFPFHQFIISSYVFLIYESKTCVVVFLQKVYFNQERYHNAAILLRKRY